MESGMHGVSWDRLGNFGALDKRTKNHLKNVNIVVLFL